MKTIILDFQSPSKLNEATEVTKTEKQLWVHAEFKGFDNGVLELDLVTWKISCPEKNVSAPINQWMVDEENYIMKLHSENIEGNFKPLDYTFAVSMLGQFLPKEKLIEYLKALQEIYKIISDPPDSLKLPPNDEQGQGGSGKIPFHFSLVVS